MRCSVENAQPPQPQLLPQLLLLLSPQPQPQQLKRMMIRMMSQIELFQLLQNIFEPFLRAMFLILPADVHGRQRYIQCSV